MIALEPALHFREKAGETIEPSMTTSMNVSDNEGGSSPKPKNSFSAFSASIDPQDAGALEDDGDGGGGLMVRGTMSIVIIRCAHFDQQSLLRANKTKKKDKKDIKKAKVSVLGLPVESVPEDTDDPVPSKHGIEVAAEDLSDEESRLMEEKKQGKKKGKAIVEEEEVAHPTGVSSWLSLISFRCLIFVQGNCRRGSLHKNKPRTLAQRFCPKRRKKSSRKSARRSGRFSGHCTNYSMPFFH